MRAKVRPWTIPPAGDGSTAEALQSRRHSYNGAPRDRSSAGNTNSRSIASAPVVSTSLGMAACREHVPLSHVTDGRTHDSLSSLRLSRLRAGKGSWHDYMSTTKSLSTHQGSRGPTQRTLTMHGAGWA